MVQLQTSNASELMFEMAGQLKVDFSGDIHKVWINGSKEIHCESIIISTGATADMGLPSEQHYLKNGWWCFCLCYCDGFSIKIK
jgi:alkyl hydroperoxide reductase subunit AhpF